MASLQILEGKGIKKTSRKAKTFFLHEPRDPNTTFFPNIRKQIGNFFRLSARLCQVWEHDCGWGQLQIPSFRRAWWNLNHIDISDGSNIVMSAFNTPRYDFESAWSYCLWRMEYTWWSIRGLKDFEIWSPTLQIWARGPDVFGHYRSYYGLLVISFPKYYSSLEQSYEDWINGDIKNNLDSTIPAGSRF